MSKSARYSPEAPEHAVWQVFEHQGGVPVAVFSDGDDCTEDWLHGGDAAEVIAPGRA